MIRQLFIVILLASSCSKEQKSKNLVDKSKDTSTALYVDKVKPKHNSSDTIFISRKLTKDYYHAIYIDTTRQSKYYKWLTDFDFVLDEDYKESYEDMCTYFKSKNHNSYKTKNFTDIPEQWIPVYPYKAKYYLYAPSDWGNAGKRIINDSAFVFLDWDIIPSPIQSIKRQGGSKYVLEIATISNENLSTEKVIIYLIDKKTKLSVFEFSDKPNEYRYELYVPVKSAKYFDMVVNYCESQKQPEYEFDEIDYQHLLKGLK